MTAEGSQGLLCVSRAVLGVVYLGWSAQAVLSSQQRSRGRSRPTAERVVAGVLGARQLVQAAVTAQRPTRTVLRLGAGVDVAHAASMVALGVASGRWRAAAFQDALVAGSLAAAGLVCARGAATEQVAGPGGRPTR